VRLDPALAVKELERLREEAVVLERDWRRAPYLIGLALLAVPAYFLDYPLLALLFLLCAPALVGTAIYLLGVRRAENRQLSEELEMELRRREAREKG
jgi:hypothetical protein